jgi:hypothetical protein
VFPASGSDVPHSEAPAASLPVQQEFVVAGTSHIEAAPQTSKKNKTKKGEGKDGVADEDDNYPFQDGHCHCLFRDIDAGEPPAKVIFEICKIVNGTPVVAQGPLSRLKRWAKRRKPNAYAWLDRNHHNVPDDVLRSVFRQARINIADRCRA